MLTQDVARVIGRIMRCGGVVPGARVASRVIVCLMASAISENAEAQRISVDGRFSPAQTLIGPNYAIGANLGRQIGGNLFHSFGVFGLNQGETATFNGPATVTNVIGRVTGGATSSIDGAIRSTIPGANVYLINPAGVVFGPHAAVNVTGGFHASSADYIRLADGSRFQATNPNVSTLTAAPPSAFGFLSASAGPVTVNGSNFGVGATRLALVGGPVAISNGILQAPAGTVHIASAAGAGEIPVDPRNGSPSTVTKYGPVQISGSQISVSGPSGVGSGSIYVHGDTVSVAANSKIYADNTSTAAGGIIALQGDTAVDITQASLVRALASASGSGADIAITTSAQGGFHVDASYLWALSSGSGAAGAIAIKTGQMAMTNAAQIASTTYGSGLGGAITIDTALLSLSAGSQIASGTTGSETGAPINLLAADTVLSGSGTSVGTTTTGSGSGGPITINTGLLAMTSGAEIVSGTGGPGAGGPINLLATDTMLSGQGTALGSVTGSATPTSLGFGPSGKLNLAGNSLTLIGGASVIGGSVGNARAGDINISLAGALTVGQTGDSANQASAIATLAELTGTGGNIRISADSIAIAGNGGLITASLGNAVAGAVSVSARTITLRDSGSITSNGAPNLVGVSNPNSLATSGSVTVTASDSLSMGGGDQYTAGSTIAANTNADHPGGNVTVQAQNISLGGTSTISSNTTGNGPGGNIAVTAGETLLIDRPTALPETSFKPGITALSKSADPAGRGGNVTVSAHDITIHNGIINADTDYAAPAGTVNVTASGAISISGVVGSTVISGISAQANVVSGGPRETGRAGDVVVKAGSIELSDQGEISSSTFGAGNAGNVTVTTSGGITISGRTVDKLTGITSQADNGSRGDAGTVTVGASNLSITGAGAGISSDTRGSGAGGSVNVAVTGDLLVDGQGATNASVGIFARSVTATGGDAGQAVVSAANVTVLDGGQIASATAGSGAGGSVTVKTYGALLLDGQGLSETQISAAASGLTSGSAGNVMIIAGSVTVQGGAQITGTTAGRGQGGSVAVDASGDIVLQGPGQQIATSSTGTGNAGSITIAAPRLSLRNGAGISTQAQSANGGNITISAADMVWLQRSSITTSVNGALGNGGNITIDPHFVILDNSVIQANAVGGNGGNVSIVANEIIPSADSSITASSQRGLSGDIVISGPLLDLNSSLVVLASTLRSATALLRESCAVRGDRPRSSLVVASPSGMREEAQTSISAMYIANQPVRDGQRRTDVLKAPAVPVMLNLSTRCG